MANTDQGTATDTMEQQAACLRQNEAIDSHVYEDTESSHGEAAAKSEAETHHDAQLRDSRQERGTTGLPESEPDPDSDRGPELESAILDAAQTNPTRLVELDLTGAATQTILHNQKQTLLESLVANRDSTSEILLTVLRHMKRGCDEGGDKVENDALSLALTHGRADLAKALLDNGISLSQTRDSGHKALWRACEHGLLEIVSLLLESGADLMENCDLEGDTPLGVACHHGQEEVVSLLLADSRIDLDKSDDMGWTPLNTAAIKGHTNIVAKLLAKGAKINLATEFGWTPLATACRNGNEETVSLLLTREDIEIDARDDDGFTPLNAAADNGHASIVSKLLAKGAAVDISSNSGWIPLTAACQQGYVETIKALVADERTDINGQDGAGWTPLGMASQHGREDAVNFLLAHRAIDIDRVDREGWTALKNASHHGRAGVVDLLLDKGAQVDIPDNKGWTALMGASKWGHYGICRRLLELHANVNLANSQKSTALHWASHRGYANLVTLLLENKADRSLRNQDGCTPLHLASQQGYAEAVMALLDQHKGVADACDHQGWTALHKASFHKDADVERLKIEEGDVKPDWDHEPVSQHHRVVELLLQHNTDIACTTLTNDTPLLLAARQGNTKCLQQLVARMTEGDINRRDYKSHTALYYAASSRDADMLRAVLERVTAADFGLAGTYMEQEALAWAADDSERHQLFAMVAEKGSVMTKKNVPDTHRESALCWAVWNADLELVCRILNSSAADSNAGKDRKSVEAVASGMLAGMKSAHIQRSKNPQTKANASKNLDRKAQRDGEQRRKEQPAASAAEREKYETILDLLRNPPIVPTTVSIQLCEMPVLGADIDISAFDAVVVDFYAKEKSSGFLRRERGIKEVIYDPDKGPTKLMAAAQETMKAQSHHLGTGNVFSPNDFKFRWIHLPANNMQWMNDLMSRIYFEKKTANTDRIYGELNRFYQRSWHQVPDPLSQFRFMKPECVMQTKEGDGTTHRLALYMPYLTFATYPLKQTSNYTALLSTYSKTAIHRFRTLDESYYQFTSDDADKERERRNKDQVVTRKLFKGDLEEVASWDLIGVEQLWLWIVDDETVITSSTHRADDRSNVVQGSVLDRLTELGHGENRRSQPSTPLELSKFIVDTCVQFYNRTKYSPAEGTHIPNPVPWSIQQFFADSVNRAAVEEAGLFKQFSDKGLIKSKTRLGHQQEDFNSVKDIYVQQTAGLLGHVKDMRDELNMIRAIVSDQETVQRGLDEEDCSAVRIISDLEEMDRATQRVYKAVEATLTLEQNVIALTQSEETIQQGRILMAFTVATIIFLPMSFLVSLFNVDITAFPHNRSGDLQYTPGWVFPIIFGVSAVIWIPLILYAFRSQVLGSANSIALRFPALRLAHPQGANTTVRSTSVADIRARLGAVYHAKTDHLRQRLGNRKNASADEEAQKGEPVANGRETVTAK